MAQLPAQQLGGLRGFVLDADFSQPVPGVDVVLEQTGASAQTDDQGTFVFNALPPQVYSLRLSKSGYINEYVSDILVEPGQIREVRVEMVSDIVELDEVVVVAEDLISDEGSDEALIFERQELGALVDSIGEDFISKLGASTAASALRSVTGTSVQDGKYVVVRGLADRYTNVLLNGGRVPSSDPRKRAVTVDIFPGKLIRSISASKTFTPDQYADGTGGSVDIRTKNIPSEFEFSVGVGLSYNTLTTQNNRWLTYPNGGAGVFAKDNGSRELPKFVENNTAPISTALPNSPASAQIYDKFTRSFSNVASTERATAPFNYSADVTLGQNFEWFGQPAGALLGLTWRREYSYKPNRLQTRFEDFGRDDPPINSSVRVFEEGTDEVLVGALATLGYTLNPSSELGLNLFYSRTASDLAANAQGTLRGQSFTEWREILTYTARSLGLVQLVGEHNIETDGRPGTVSWLVSAARTTEDLPDARVFASSYDTFANRYFLNTGTTTPTLRRQWRSLEETAYSFKLDFDMPVWQDHYDDNSFKWGAFMEYTKRDFEQQAFEYRPGNLPFAVIDGQRVNVRSFTPPPGSDQTWADVFLDPRRIGYAGVSNFMTWYAAPTPGETSTYLARQILGAFYAMYDGHLTEDIKMILGARGAYTDLNVAGTGDVLFDSNEADIQQFDLLPAVSLTWDVYKDMKLRGAWSRTIARPTFLEIAPAVYRDFRDDTVFFGNPDLLLSSISNWDIRWEWFPREGEIVAVSFFTKHITRPLELVEIKRGEGNNVTTYRNFPEGIVYGAEFEVRKRLDWHSELLRDFSVGLNYGYFLSDVKLDPDELEARRKAGTTTDRRLQGQPDYTMNVNLDYDNEETGLYWGLFYNIVGQQVVVAGQGGRPDVIERPAPSLNFTIRKKFWDNWQFTFRASNLLNPERKRVIFHQGQELIYDQYRSGRNYSVSLGFDW